jgi:hypothetical protein
MVHPRSAPGKPGAPGPRTPALPGIDAFTPPDPEELFHVLVEARRRGDCRPIKSTLAALRATGWSVVAIEPVTAGGDR